MNKVKNTIIAKMKDFTPKGNIIHEEWYKTIVTAKGTANTNAILILSDIVYWYRPKEVLDKNSNLVTFDAKYVHDDFLQRNYAQLSERLNLSKTQVRNAVIELEKLGIIKRHFRNIHTSQGTLPNVMFIELIPDKLIEFSFPQKNSDDFSKDININIDTCTSIVHDICMNQPHNIDDITGTNTESTTPSTTITTTPSDVDVTLKKAHDIFKPLKLNESDINAILKATNYDLEKCHCLMEQLANSTTPINNVVGWMITAARYNFKPKSFHPNNPNKGTFERNYDKKYLAELEERLLAR